MINLTHSTVAKRFLFLLALFTPSMIVAQNVRTPMEPEVLKNVFWSLCVQDAETGESLVDIRSSYLMTPASTLKVLTTATALECVSPETRLSTKLYTTGVISEGVLSGDVLIVGEGDPSIGSRHLKDTSADSFFNNVAHALTAKGVKKIKGNIIALSPKSFDHQGLNPRWLHYDMGNHYAAGAYALNLFDNSYNVIFTDYGRKFTHTPSVPGLKLKRSYVISKSRKTDSLYIARPSSGEQVHLITGIYPAGVKQWQIRGDIPDPPLFFAQYLAMTLKKKGISIQGESRTSGLLPDVDKVLLYEHLSPTMMELARLTNVHSINLYAESLLRCTWVGKPALEGHNPTQTALHQSGLYWQGRGLSGKEINVFDGSGLSPENKVTANYLSSLLGKVYRGDSTHLFMMTLPMAGKEGTVTSFLKGTPLAGRAYLKSGSIKNVIAYTGYIVVPDGKVYTVTLMANNFTLRHSEMRKVFEGILLDTFTPALGLEMAEMGQ